MNAMVCEREIPASFLDYTRRRLDAWGDEFRLDRDSEILGGSGKNMIYVLMEHHGEMPSRPTGFKPFTVPLLEMQIEDLVRRLFYESSHLAIVLRAYYCGSGRRGVERLEIARKLLGQSLSKRVYFAHHNQGFYRVAEFLRENSMS